uniref:Uncharacterized protein n=1 Tax=Tanacetum cinerariifolium TaxID=118510 RepID=A0A699GYU7_TANCI|nr:hypothetical protein [Tanacetum cinerariifolium]
MSSKGPSKALIQLYNDGTNEDVEELMFSKYGGKKVQRPKKPTPTVIVKSLVPIKNCAPGLANVNTWDCILKMSFGVKKPGIVQTRQRGKESFEAEIGHHVVDVKAICKSTALWHYKAFLPYGAAMSCQVASVLGVTGTNVIRMASVKRFFSFRNVEVVMDNMLSNMHCI